ncbi:hypothetical protein F2P81_004712 [Scophthalmus maximus]|uniref:Uncharacterized protein n=1 Tax=Scophthalmus maximus TaxID=52904 RepID=A0A6A4TDX6_SCOMX|nr:hypothetical protein F2P81_004712 [Scophthalmus maximus]
MYFWRILWKNNLQVKRLVSIHRCSTESVLMYCIFTWSASSPSEGRRLRSDNHWPLIAISGGAFFELALPH